MPVTRKEHTLGSGSDRMINTADRRGSGGVSGSGGPYLPLIGGVMTGDIRITPDAGGQFGSLTKAWSLVAGLIVYTNNIYDISGDVTKINNDFNPGSNNTYDLGSSSLAFAEGYIDTLFVDDLQDVNASGHILVAEALDPKAGNTHDLGAPTLYWDLAYVDNVITDRLDSLDASGNILVADDLDPVSSGAQDLGDGTLYWQLGFVDDLDVDTLTSRVGADIIFKDSIDPNGGGNYDLGDATNYWQLGYIDDIFCDTIASRSGTSVNFQDNVDMGAKHITLTEMVAPSGATNTARIFAEINGSNKTDLRVRFQSGVSVLIATEP